MLSQLALGQEIPDALYQAIVEIYVYFLNFDPSDPEKARRERAALAAQAEEYNAETASLKSQYTVYAKEQIHSMFQYYRENEPERLNYFASEELICEAAAHLARCALYRNAQQLFYEDPAMAYALSGEEGGSGELWAAALHQGFQAGGNLVMEVEAYLDQVDAFVDALDGAAQ